MHPIILYELAESEVDELQREAERRRRLRETVAARPHETSGPSMATRVRELVLRPAPVLGGRPA